MSIAFGLLAGLCNAVNVVTQHVASTAAPGIRGWRLVVHLFKSPLWMFGWAAIAGAFLFQALALHGGQLSVVQPLLVSELVFALVLRRVWLRQGIRGVTWLSATVTSVGLALFLVASEPQGGITHPTQLAWISATTTWVVVAGGLVLWGRSGSRHPRAALYGAGAAIMWALVAAYMKEMTESFADFGFGAFAHWPVYALAAAGLLAELLTQATLHAGPLSISQPFLVIVDPLVSIALSVWIFREYFTPDVLALVVGTLSFGAMCLGVVFLIRTAPTTMERGESR